MILFYQLALNQKNVFLNLNMDKTIDIPEKENEKEDSNQIYSCGIYTSHEMLRNMSLKAFKFSNMEIPKM